MNEKLLEYFKSDDIHLIQCEHKWCDTYGYEKSQMKKDILDYITNLQQENEKLKYNARGQANDYFKDKYADEVLKNAELTKENERLKEENILLKASEPMSKIAEDYGYKSRCKKAMELLKLPIVYETHQENGERDELLKKIRQAINILKGSDENE